MAPAQGWHAKSWSVPHFFVKFSIFWENFRLKYFLFQRSTYVAKKSNLLCSMHRNRGLFKKLVLYKRRHLRLFRIYLKCASTRSWPKPSNHNPFELETYLKAHFIKNLTKELQKMFTTHVIFFVCWLWVFVLSQTNWLFWVTLLIILILTIKLKDFSNPSEQKN